MRKKRLILLVALGFTASMQLAAQLPEVSTADNPKWYYIQVLGSDTRVGRVFTAEGSKVYGREISASIDPDVTSKQLWRFEKNANGSYVVVNKSTGLQLDLDYDASQETGHAALAKTASVTFKLNKIGDYYQFESSKSAPSTPAAELYLHQGNAGYDFLIITVDTTWGSGDNSKFSFKPFVDYSIEYSDDKTETYYQLTNTSKDFNGQVIKEQTSNEDSDDAAASVVLEAADESDASTQWRAVETKEGVQFVNRATQHQLQTLPEVFGAFNILRTGTIVAKGNAWTAIYLGNGQYCFSATATDDNVTRYLGANTDNTAPEKAPKDEDLVGSAFAWTLKKVETIATGVDDATSQDKPAVSVKNGVIRVSGKAPYTIHTLSGKQAKAGEKLMPGVYLVTIGGTTTKVLVK